MVGAEALQLKIQSRASLCDRSVCLAESQLTRAERLGPWSYSTQFDPHVVRHTTKGACYSDHLLHEMQHSKVTAVRVFTCHDRHEHSEPSR